MINAGAHTRTHFRSDLRHDPLKIIIAMINLPHFQNFPRVNREATIMSNAGSVARSVNPRASGCRGDLPVALAEEESGVVLARLRPSLDTEFATQPNPTLCGPLQVPAALGRKPCQPLGLRGIAKS